MAGVYVAVNVHLDAACERYRSKAGYDLGVVGYLSVADNDAAPYILVFLNEPLHLRAHFYRAAGDGLCLSGGGKLYVCLLSNASKEAYVTEIRPSKRIDDLSRKVAEARLHGRQLLYAAPFHLKLKEVKKIVGYRRLLRLHGSKRRDLVRFVAHDYCGYLPYVARYGSRAYALTGAYDGYRASVGHIDIMHSLKLPGHRGVDLDYDLIGKLYEQRHKANG